MIKKNQRLFIIITSLLTVIFVISPLFLDLLWARPGGGHSFSGGGGGSFSGGGGGGGEGIGFLIYLIFSQLPPQISIPLIIGIIVLRLYLQKRKNSDRTTIVSSPGIQARTVRHNNVENAVLQLKSVDPNFSKVLFLDFVSSIFNKYYTWFGTKEFKNLSPFFGQDEFLKSESLRNNQRITEIVIGNMRVSEINFFQDITGISVDIEANYTFETHGKKTRYVITERWYFNRKNGILSPEPDKMHKLSCPNCGAPVNFTDNGVCQSCGTKINLGEMQWFVKKHKILSQEVFRTTGLAHYEPESGTNLQTIYQSGITSYAGEFAQLHNLDWNSWRLTFADKVVKAFFIKIYDAWSRNKLDNVRNLLSDRLYESFMFWINAYKNAGLTNKLENITIQNIQFARIDSDRFYESITVRIFASSLDYVVDANGDVKGGSNKRPRTFSEYWTFIRRTGVEKDAYDYATCPNCGAPADKMGQAGVCEYCGTKISNGDFSWVLAVITQDEVYSG
ncbi:MAG: TIM44-like domain-containing protein [Chlorobi bacterium]|nr:TIM44-like domain-containing protein [Chlorobiota bacterium]